VQQPMICSPMASFPQTEQVWCMAPYPLK
jgi:hypothetical protein